MRLKQLIHDQGFPRGLMALASGLLLFLFLFPLWKITLEAPQFPDGIYMNIWINKITGSGEHILQNINILNHYIGMKKIEPDSIPELSWFPYVVIGMVILGVIIAILNKQWLFLGWSILLMILGALGIYDFYLWEYDYGHNLDPTAPIKIPGMVYQPPLFGRKDLLNFIAYSYPSWGALFIGLAIVLSSLAFFLKRRIRSPKTVAILACLLMGLHLNSCTPVAEEIRFGTDGCHYCKMVISDSRFGAELVSDKCKIFKFDALECLMAYQREHAANPVPYAFTLAVSYDQPGKLQVASSLHYLISPKLPSPMGAYLSGFSSIEMAQKMQEEYSGELFDWISLKKHINSRYNENESTHSHMSMYPDSH